MNKEVILHTALEKLKETTGIDGEVDMSNPIDSKIKLKFDDKEWEFNTEVKREIRPHQIAQIEAIHHHFGGNFIVVAEKIYPKVKAELRELAIPYLEANGNLYVKKGQIWVWIDVNPPIKLTKDTGNRAFTKTGLKVLFHFILDGGLINKPQGHIAAFTKVAIGNIPQILEGLLNTGYIHPLNKKTYMWEDRKALLDRWITEYATTLRPSILLGRFQITGDWKKIHLAHEKSLWGGEPAADLLTDYLRPEEFILYTKETRQELIKNYKLKPHKDGELYVYKWFWEEGLNRINFVPPILIYADLMIKGDKRCRDTAKMILDNHVNFI